MTIGSPSSWLEVSSTDRCSVPGRVGLAGPGVMAVSSSAKGKATIPGKSVQYAPTLAPPRRQAMAHNTHVKPYAARKPQPWSVASTNAWRYSSTLTTSPLRP